jgi:hypothetical protein
MRGVTRAQRRREKQSGQMHFKLNPVKAANRQAQVLSSRQQQKEEQEGQA